MPFLFVHTELGLRRFHASGLGKVGKEIEGIIITRERSLQIVRDERRLKR